jgi:hypothetical protein
MIDKDYFPDHSSYLQKLTQKTVIISVNHDSIIPRMCSDKLIKQIGSEKLNIELEGDHTNFKLTVESVERVRKFFDLEDIQDETELLLEVENINKAEIILRN